MFSNNYFKVGGSLPYEHPTYIQRRADHDIYDALIQREFCYVLNSRQMGKSSLRVRTMKTLANQGFKCLAIDLGILGKSSIPNKWYGGLVSQLWRNLRLTSGAKDYLKWWNSHSELLPALRFSQFIEDVLLVNCQADIVIFLDEVDNIINLDFCDEFLTLIRNCYERRVEDLQYYRLTFCLLGVATPSNLKRDKKLTHFNIGRAIQLTGFNLEEAQPLILGLKDKFSQPEIILEKILYWTRGQPFLTQKICSLVVHYGNESEINISQLIQQRIIDNWEIQDEPEHLKTIRDRLLYNQENKARLLTIYQRILENDGIPIDGSESQVELRLSGIVSRQQDNQLKVSNPIYEQVFNQQWVAEQLFAISPYQNAIAAWKKSNRQDQSRLLRGEALAEAQNWSRKHSITDLERDFLQQSEILAIEEQKRDQLAIEAEFTAKKLAQEKKLVRWQRLFILFSLAMITGFYLKSRQTNLSNITTLVQSSEALFASNQKLDALIAAIKAKQQLNQSLWVNQSLIQQSDTALQQVVYGVKEYNRLIGHQDRLNSIAVNGKLIATAGTDNTVRLWTQKASGWHMSRVLNHAGWVVDVAISPDGKTIASASRDRSIKLWHQDGRLLRVLKHPQVVTSVAITANNQILSGSENGTIKVWHQDKNKIIQTLKGHSATVQAIAVSPDGKIVSASEDKTLKVWQQGRVIRTLQGHTEGVRAVAITSDGSKIISGSRDKTLKIWNSDDGTEVATLKGHLAPVYGVAINPLNNQIVSASGDKTLKIWHSNGTEIDTLRGHNNRVGDAAYLPDGKIASASWDKTARLWQSNQKLSKTLSGHQDVAIAIDYNSDLIASTSDDKTVKLWNQAGTLVKTFRQHTAEVYDVAIHQQVIASVGADQTLKIWQANGNLLKNISAHNSAIWAVAIHPDGNKIVTGGNDNLIKIWDLEGNLLHTLKGHRQKVWDLAIHPQNNTLVSASEDNTLKIWDFQGNLLRTLKGHQDAVRTVTYSHDGKQIISGSEDHSLKIWDLQGNNLATLDKHNASVKGVAISPDNQYLASVSDDGNIILWQNDGQTWHQYKTLQGHNNSVWSVAFSPDGKTLATAGEDAKIILWNLANISTLDPLQYGCHWLKDYLRTSAIGNQDICP